MAVATERWLLAGFLLQVGAGVSVCPNPGSISDEQEQEVTSIAGRARTQERKREIAAIVGTEREGG